MLLRDFDPIEYPIVPESSPTEFRTMPWPHKWWLKSEIRLLSESDVRAVVFDLFCVALCQNPIGTLPNNERLLVRLIGLPLEDWRRLMARRITPLNGWETCICGDEGIRLYHPKSLEIAKEASNAKGKT
ncbi:hypothetical protein [Octadecabacter ascidiaceicola]|uniref:Uncharacterized protein n=1 Tax=Octadecabacter ascidiaceicola TaxID=1655543 RepID=A0A238K3Y9_9RHOB|nr:hypothetical protein [Octadecabacter ascidiaceicola]SMX37167.1 hypothetical protein OCA8868_01307 [Octadecabacter ascidiaceicola]